MDGKKIAFIVKRHKEINQKYDGLPYQVHLIEVVNYIKKYKHHIPTDKLEMVMICGWGHDVLEDPPITYNDVKKVLGEEITDIIFLLANEKGKVRGERANDKYYEGIKNNYFANFVKLCDRLANMRYGILHNNRNMFDMYKKELPHFKESIYNGHFDDMWNELDNMEFTEKDSEVYPKVDKFTKDNLFWAKLPSPIPAHVYKELYTKGIVPKNKLEKNRYYFGKCRNADVALWNGHEFVYMRLKFGHRFPETINHLEDDNGYDLFIPLEKVTPTEEQIVKYG